MGTCDPASDLSLASPLTKRSTMWKAAICLLICLAFEANALKGKVCTDESQCDPDECCQILSEYMIVSRQAVDLPPEIAFAEKKGTCEKYRLEGSGCDTLAKINGYCGCAPGLRCHQYEIKAPKIEEAPALSRRDMRPSRPGYHWVSQCQKM